MARTGSLTVKPREAGRLLGLGRNKTYELLRNGTIPSLLLGKRRLVPRSALDAFLATAADTPKEDSHV